MDNAEGNEATMDSESSSSDEEQNALESRAEELERQISDNKYLYDVHVELVDIYFKLTDLNSFRAAYERFHEYFPLTPSLWLSWINIEIQISNTPAEKKQIFTLFDKAVEDYLSVKLWIEYAQFAMGECKPDEVRALLERALNSAGLHVNEGSLLWDTLREFELAHLGLCEPQSEDWQLQAMRIYEVFKRQLSVALLDMDKTYKEWQDWLALLPEGHNLDPKPIEWGYQNALKTLEICKPFETSLLSSENEEEIQTIYENYIKAVSDPALIICLYERAVTRLSLNVSIWLNYCLYIIKFGDAALSVAKRAVRNCPWGEELWIAKIRILEQLSAEELEVTQCLEQGLTSVSPGLELWLAYLENAVRTSRPHLHKLFTQASEQLGDSDSSFKILRWQARIYAKNDDMPAARRVWSQIMQTNKPYSNAWLEYAFLERQYGDPTHLRLLFQKALIKCTDWPQLIADEWLLFEREFGTLPDVLKCVEKCKDVIKISPKIEPVKVTSKVANNPRKRTLKNEVINVNNRTKRLKMEETRKPPLDPEKTVFLSNMHPHIDETALQFFFPNAVNVTVAVDRKGSSRCYGYAQFAEAKEVDEALARDRERLDSRPLYISRYKKEDRTAAFKYAATPENNKLFIKGLPLESTQEELEGIFKPYGATEIRLVLKRNGKSKGLAYVDFLNENAATEALKATDGLEIGAHKISVAISAPPVKRMEGSEPIRHARSRLQMPLIPRSVKVPEKNGSGPSKSNEDFRKMLMDT